MRRSYKGRNNPMWGKKHSPETIEKIKKARAKQVFSKETRKKLSDIRKKIARRGKDHPQWKGEEVSYKVLHKWVRRYKGVPKQCSKCGTKKRGIKNLHWANVDGQYKRDLDDYIALCNKCHAKLDNRPGSPKTIKLETDKCKRGHMFTKENTYWKSDGTRSCKRCRHLNYLKYYYGKE